MRSILMIMVVLSASVGYGQVVINPGTVQGDYLCGQGELIRSEGSYLRDKGSYEKDHEVARDLYLKNRKQGIRDRWEIQDEYAERYYNNSKRIINQPNPSRSLIGYNGKYYKSFADLKKDPVAYEHMQTEALTREWRRKIEKAVEAEKDAQAIDFLKRWDRMGLVERQALKNDRELRYAAPDLWWAKHNPAPVTQREKHMGELRGVGVKDR